jgi:cation-transporting P-type ATPase E
MTDLARSAGDGSATVAGRRLPGREPAPAGLSGAEAERRLAAARRPRRPEASRSYASIVRANVLTVFNLILAGFGTLTLIFGDARDALFLGIIVANSTIGIAACARSVSKLTPLDRLRQAQALARPRNL